MIKTIALLSLAMIMLFTLGACGNSQSQSNDTISSTPESKDTNDLKGSESEQNSTAPDSSQIATDAESSVLIAYFSGGVRFFRKNRNSVYDIWGRRFRQKHKFLKGNFTEFHGLSNSILA